MFINESMTRDLVTIQKGTPILNARELMVRRKIRHLPVVDSEKRILGIITDRDIRSALPRDVAARPVVEEERAAFASLTAGDIMTTELIVVKPTYTIQDALLLFQQHTVGALPVVDDEGVVRGILSVRDLMRAFVNVMGIGEPGTLLGIIAEEKIGQMKKIVDTITAENISIGSILVARYWDQDKRAVFPYILTLNVSRVKKKLAALGFVLLDPMKWYLDQFSKNE